MWYNLEDKLPLCYKTGDWDGKKSDSVLIEDRFGKFSVAVCYEGHLDGDYYFDWFDDADGSGIYTPNIKRWTDIPD